MISDALSAILQQLEKNRRYDLTYDSLMVILDTLRDDRTLNDFLIKQKQGELKIAISDDADIVASVKGMYPQYDGSSLDAIQRALDNSTQMADYIAQHCFNGSNVPDTNFYRISHERIMQLQQQGIHVSVEFGVFSHNGTDSLYAVVSYDCENFVLETKTVIGDPLTA